MIGRDDGFPAGTSGKQPPASTGKDENSFVEDFFFFFLLRGEDHTIMLLIEFY